jgi:hypothetical protein
VGKSPRYWLLTGVYLMTNASQANSLRNSSMKGASGVIPLPEPSGMTTLLANMKVAAASAEKTSRDMFATGDTLKAERVYAARWQRIKVKKFAVEDWNDLIYNQFKLEEKFSEAVVRGPKGDKAKEVIELEIDNNDIIDFNETDDDIFDEEFWEEFDVEMREEEGLGEDSDEDV